MPCHSIHPWGTVLCSRQAHCSLLQASWLRSSSAESSNRVQCLPCNTRHIHLHMHVAPQLTLQVLFLLPWLHVSLLQASRGEGAPEILGDAVKVASLMEASSIDLWGCVRMIPIGCSRCVPNNTYGCLCMAD